MQDQPEWARVGLMIRIAREFGCLPNEVAERLPAEWFEALHGFFAWEAHMQNRPLPEHGGNVS